MVRSSFSLGPALVFVALVTILVGAGIYLALDETLGAVIAAFGLLDLVTIPLVLRLVRRGGEGQDPEHPDPAYNPYARED